MMKYLLFLVAACLMFSCSENQSTARQLPPDPHPKRFIGTWQASETEYVNDNLKTYMESAKKDMTAEQYAKLSAAQHERILQKLIGELDDVNTWVKFMDNGLAEWSCRKNGTFTSVSLYKWAYSKGEIHFTDDDKNDFSAYELAGQLVREWVQEEKPKGLLKVRYNKAP